ncbi:nucleoside deaminase [Nocardia cyriacigeorgica]|uniref:Nucleoside deaminase n=1 Tax=Nocardia cyriacigeorgica TaxID=135487 RepID=A0A6P1DAA5_9NOCA|nr:nucleoside deaminase [Nocardia cyriacigeorgica]NEW45643.1 nucleoside deaminase [Nocardia cyriacigeorgica]NEW48860.1 nucleoside deaminase [Nocardia cyriacigeorgica]NEW56137.1 nucleoside deaminase [Nocardia cyriacigeorgica]
MSESGDRYVITDRDRNYLRRCVELARAALDDGDEPFGSILVDAEQTIRFEARNRIVSGDPTQHPEFEIARWAGIHLTPEQRAGSVVYTSGEHCPMCSAAHAWAGLGRIIYAADSAQLGQWQRDWGLAPGPVAAMPITQVAPSVPVAGPEPTLEAEIKALHAELAARRRT